MRKLKGATALKRASVPDNTWINGIKSTNSDFLMNLPGLR